MKHESEIIRGTTILSVRRGGKAVIGGDGQVTLGATVIKGTSVKVRTLRNGDVIVGFAGAAADAFALMERFESKLEQYNGNMRRAAIELCKDWRTDRYLRRLEAVLVAADRDVTLMISGTGDVLEPDEDAIAAGSGGAYALAVARALMRHTDMPAKKIVEESLKIASEICIYTNTNFTIEEIDSRS
jgi:ATP-dependent HslUV protease, peptidase subunit HslV